MQIEFLMDRGDIYYEFFSVDKFFEIKKFNTLLFR